MTNKKELDRAARKQALDTTQSYIVQAPAGSGKTSLLLSRFICLLETVENPEEILAVTFTRKATRNMRDRILRLLDPHSTEDLFDENANAAVLRVRKRSEELQWKLHENPSRLQIMTIDALVMKLVRQMPWSSRFGSVPGVADNLNDLFNSAARNVVDMDSVNDAEVRNALQILLRRLDNRSGPLQELLVEMLSKRDQWLRFVIDERFDSGDYRRIINETWSAVRKRHLKELRRAIPQQWRKQIVEIAAQAAANLAAQDSIGNSSKGILNCLDLTEFPGTDIDSMPVWEGLATLMLTDKGGWRKQLNKNTGFPPEQRDLKDDFIEILFNLGGTDDLDALLDGVRKLPTDEISDNDWEVMGSIVKVLPYAVAKLLAEFRNQGRVDFIELAQQAAYALGTSENPTDLSLVLDYRFKHILVDEFQDTSLSQRQLLESLTVGWEPDDGRTLFLVGDPMQSIYRFREAEVGIYLDVRKKGLQSVKPNSLTLNQNFRSNDNLVNWYNSTFCEVFPQKEESSLGQVLYSPCISERAAGQIQNVHVRLRHTYQPEEDEPKPPTAQKNQSERHMQAKQLVEDLKNYLQRTEKPEAVILVRSRPHFFRILPLLKEAGISYYAHEVVPMNNRPVVKDILALTRALLYLADRTSWLAILRAPWCGLELNDLLKVASGDSNALIWDAVNNEEIFNSLSKSGQERLERTRQTLHRAFKAFGRGSLRDWVEDTWILLGGPACTPEHDLENVQIVLDLIADYTVGYDVKNLIQFEGYIDGLYSVPDVNENKAQVKVMTIHGSKGLEFDAVFIPYLDAQPRRSTDPLMVWGETEWDGSTPSLLFSPISAKGGDPLKTYEFLKEWNKKKDILELTRLIYVACTRAKNELYLYGTVKKDPQSSQGTMLGQLWPGVRGGPIMEAIEPEIESDETAEHPLPSLARLPVEWRLPEAPEAVQLDNLGVESPDETKIDFDWAGNLARGVGTVVHEWLQRIFKTGIDNWSVDRLKNEQNDWRVKLAALGVTNKEMPDAIDRTRRALENAIEDNRGRWLLGEEHQESEAEWRLTGYFDEQIRNVILDRTFVDNNGVRWIVDYKTGWTDGAVEAFLDNEKVRYQNQLENYAKHISSIENRPIMLGLYFPLHKGWREWRYEPQSQTEPNADPDFVDDIKRLRYNQPIQE